MPTMQTVKHTVLALALAFAFTCVRASAASAHHSFAMYDQTKLVNLVGTVKEFQWTNPHVILWLVKDQDPRAGEATHEEELWTIELPTSTGNLARMDWSKHSLVPGDHVTVELNPLRDGRHGGSFKKATVAGSGKVLVASPPANPAADVSADADDKTAPVQPAVAAPAQPAGDKLVQVQAHPQDSNQGCSVDGAVGHTQASWCSVAGMALLLLWAAARRAGHDKPQGAPRAEL